MNQNIIHFEDYSSKEPELKENPDWHIFPDILSALLNEMQ